MGVQGCGWGTRAGATAPVQGSWRARLTDPLGGKEVVGSRPLWKGAVLVAALTNSRKLGDFRPYTVLVSQL